MTPAAPRKALCTMGCGRQVPLLALSYARLRTYASRHSYRLFVRTRSAVPGRPPSWSKIRLLQELLQTHDLVVWLDADTVILDLSLDIASELAPSRFLYLVEHRYDGQRFLNCGVMMLRAGEEADAFLERVWGATDLIDHVWWETAATMNVLGYDLDPARPARSSEFASGTKLLSNEWNSIRHDPHPKARIVHYAASRNRRRMALMARDLVRTSPIWKKLRAIRP